MHPIRYAACALALGFLAPAWAINKCTGADGKVSFQDAPCAGGSGEKIEVRPAMEGATPVPPSASKPQEGTFGPSWQRKHFLQNQGVPQARAAVERNQRECAAQPAEAVATAGPLRKSIAAGNQFAQERVAAAGKDKAACDARTEELREQLRALEKELSTL
ncbi:DUF4124 domain-containing protein [Acidovorax sp. sic0104]|uniref:DUF4124 domain-containing protein n=1 Tax=Acidovorax sp. sic0104 TaxID=2854784 RepID=UPI001C4699E8|nr:DUF4124 domain-containing protein [Acidovorax sp. sic0104]MBV7544018.1 DUF4124 domain-containing protein [Acidovorax sp. sic0104]